MKILIINQVFWPDTAATAQHLTDLAIELGERGHDVKIFCSRFAYEDTSQKFASHEFYNGIEITRLGNTGFGKKTPGGRLVDFASFNFLLFLKLLFLKRRKFDVIIGMTSPPLVSFFGILIAKLKGTRFFYWTMDLQPELSIASGLLRERSLVSRLLTGIGNYIIKRSDKIVALDSYMKEYLIKRGAKESNIDVIPVWPVLENECTTTRLENPFRKEQGFEDKIVIMYSGNHAFVHPLDTLLEAAKELQQEKDILFVFIGEGVRKKDVTAFKTRYGLDNIIQLPYQPRANIHNSLGAADLQVVIMGMEQVGFTHPNKIYGAMFAGKPILYIGPETSHITDILGQLNGNILVTHSQSALLVNEIRRFKAMSQEERELVGASNKEYALDNFHPDGLKNNISDTIERIHRTTHIYKTTTEIIPETQNKPVKPSAL